MEILSLERYNPSPERVRQFKEGIYSNLDQAMLFFLFGYFMFGVGLGFVYNSWLLAFGAGMTNFLLFFSYFLLKNKPARRYLYSLNLFLFTIQFIVQLEGAFYMHFIFFISFVILSAYGNWKILIPYFFFSLIYYVTSIFQMYSGTLSWGKYFINDPEIVSSQFISVTLVIGLAQLMVTVFLANFINKLLFKSAKRSIYLQDQLNIENNINLAQQVANGDFEGEYKLKENDQMGAALLEMRKSLEEGSKRDSKNKWISDGIAHISDILIASGDVSEISHNVLREIIRYMEVEHGGLFTLNTYSEEEPFLELRSFFAFDKSEFIERKLALGDTLVGEAAARKKTIHLKEVPDAYVSIASGLGGAPPQNILIIPLMVKDEVLGVMEIASLHTIEPHKLEFMEKVTANIAVSILSANAASQTATLLHNMQIQNIQMKAQEEAMRANMQALSKTQEELSHQVEAREVAQMELSSRMKVINEMAIVIEFDLRGRFTFVNTQFMELFKYSKNEVIGNNYEMILNPENTEEEIENVQEELEHSNTYVGAIEFLDKNKKTIWLEFAIAPILSVATGKPQKFICVGFDITPLKQKEGDIERLLEQSGLRNQMLNYKEEEMQKSLQSLEQAEEELSEQVQFSMRQQEFYDLILSFIKGVVYRSVKEKDWQIEYINSGVYEMTGYLPSDFMTGTRKFSSLVHPEDQELVAKEFTKNYQNFSLQYRIICKNGSTIWVEEKGKQLYDAYLQKNVVVGFMYDITDTFKHEAK